jgi:hypothetical protein
MSKRTGIERPPGRPRKEPPVGAAETVRELAADGHSVVGIAERLGVSLDTFRRWCDEDAELQAALDKGREKERYRLHNLLSQAADGGNITAMIFLLKAKHGYVEGQQQDQTNRVSITFALPGAMPLNEFKVIQNDTDDTTKRISATSTNITRGA